jgi:Uma2 family endonuclease
VLIEILSPSTRDRDYGGKFELYRQIPAFEEYLLVSQPEPNVEVFRKSSDDL